MFFFRLIILWFIEKLCTFIIFILKAPSFYEFRSQQQNNEWSLIMKYKIKVEKYQNFWNIRSLFTFPMKTKTKYQKRKSVQHFFFYVNNRRDQPSSLHVCHYYEYLMHNWNEPEKVMFQISWHFRVQKLIEYCG